MQQLRTGAGHGSRPREGNREFDIGQLLQKAARVRRDGGASRYRRGNSALQRLLQGSRRVSYYIYYEGIRDTLINTPETPVGAVLFKPDRKDPINLRPSYFPARMGARCGFNIIFPLYNATEIGNAGKFEGRHCSCLKDLHCDYGIYYEQVCHS